MFYLNASVIYLYINEYFNYICLNIQYYDIRYALVIDLYTKKLQNMSKKTSLLLMVVMLVSATAFSQVHRAVKLDDYPFEKREIINIPNILGYEVLKCDFHIHTSNSDGDVTAQTRVQEAWEEGLDAIAITDHISHSKGQKEENQAYDRGINDAVKKGIILIKGGEITFDLNPGPGHVNALFLQDVNKLQSNDWKEALIEAKKQGAYIFWNHPGWAVDTIRWYDEQTEMLKNGMIHGIEIFNEFEYYPEAMNWCLEKNLTFLANTDVHKAIDRLYDFNKIKHRPMTLVLSKGNTEVAIKEALFAGRTIMYAYNIIAGKEEFVKALFEASVNQSSPQTLDTNTTRFVFTNTSGIDFKLKNTNNNGLPETIMVPGQSSVNVIVKNENLQPTVFEVENALINGYDHLKVTIFQ